MELHLSPDDRTGEKEQAEQPGRIHPPSISTGATNDAGKTREAEKNNCYPRSWLATITRNGRSRGLKPAGCAAMPAFSSFGRSASARADLADCSSPSSS